MKHLTALVAAVLAGASAGVATAQPHTASEVEIAWNRYYDADEIDRLIYEIGRAYPQLVEVRSLGTSRDGRDMLMAIVTSPDVAKGTDEHASRPAMWIDGNIHANEIQAAEVVLYTLWHLTKSYGENPELTALLDRTTFYLMPVVNPDSRAYWFSNPRRRTSRGRTPGPWTTTATA